MALLVAPNRVTTPFPVYPLGVDYVAAALRPRHDVRVVDLGVSDSHDALLAALAALEPDLVGISIRNIDNTEANHPAGFVGEIEQLVRLLRARSAAKIVLGGPGFSLFPEAVLARVAADFGIVGEGEWVVALVDALEKGGDLSLLPGLVLPDRAAPQTRPWQGEYARSMPTPVQLEHYLRRGGMVNLQTKRGCPYHCSYCTYPLIEGSRVRCFDPERVADEWMELVRAGAKFIFVTDSVFNSHPAHNLAVAAALEKRGASTPWGAFFAPTRLPKGYFARLKATGLTHVEFGTESLSAPALRAYRKPFTVDLVHTAHAAARDQGLHIAHYIMLGGPGETLQTASETLDQCDKLQGVAALFFFCGVRIYPNTAIAAVARELGQVLQGDTLLEPRFFQSPDAAPAELEALVRGRAASRPNWIVGSGSPVMAAAMKRMHARGAVGPLWERLDPRFGLRDSR